jgi:ribosome-associated protein
MFHTNRTPEPKKDPNAVEIPMKELELSYARSGGPGGQNVNKTATKVVLHWDFWKSEALNTDQKMAIQRDTVLSNRMNKEGVIVLHEQTTRSQDSNRELVIQKLHDLVKNALTPQTERIETKVPKWKKHERVEDKRQHSRRKQDRSARYDD